MNPTHGVASDATQTLPGCSPLALPHSPPFLSGAPVATDGGSLYESACSTPTCGETEVGITASGGDGDFPGPGKSSLFPELHDRGMPDALPLAADPRASTSAIDTAHADTGDSMHEAYAQASSVASVEDSENVERVTGDLGGGEQPAEAGVAADCAATTSQASGGEAVLGTSLPLVERDHNRLRCKRKSGGSSQQGSQGVRSN